MTYRPITLGDCRGGDTSAKIGITQARNLAQAGVKFLWRFVFFGPPRLGDLDAAEANALRMAGITLLVVQHVRSGSWEASGPTGRQDAFWAVQNARTAGYVPVTGCPPPCIAVDMESVRNPGSMAVAHALAWCQTVEEAGYRPVVYQGFDCGLTPQQLADLGVPIWSDFGPRLPPPGRGFCCKQSAQCIVAGVPIDPDHAYPDLTGECLVGMGEADVEENEETADPTRHDTDPAPPPNAA